MSVIIGFPLYQHHHHYTHTHTHTHTHTLSGFKYEKPGPELLLVIVAPGLPWQG
jgi:hypothetical protein